MSNVVCLIQCKMCGFQYMGETGQLLHCRLNGHCFDISHGGTQKSAAAGHFNSMCNSEADVSVMVIDKLWRISTILCKIQENRWIRVLGTLWPTSMNLRTADLWSMCSSCLLFCTTGLFPHWKSGSLWDSDTRDVQYCHNLSQVVLSCPKLSWVVPSSLGYLY